MTKDKSGPAFPVPGFMDGNGNTLYPEYGMSLRDWFAGQALAGLLAHASGECPHKAPGLAYTLADAMLREREK